VNFAGSEFGRAAWPKSEVQRRAESSLVRDLAEDQPNRVDSNLSLPSLLPLLERNYPFFVQRAAGPRPSQATAPAAFCSRKTRRTMFRLTPRQACSN